jgi:hypothetical protein
MLLVNIQRFFVWTLAEVLDKQLLLQVAEHLLLFWREVAVAPMVDFAFAGVGRHFAERAHGVQHFPARRGSAFEVAACGAS